MPPYRVTLSEFGEVTTYCLLKYSSQELRLVSDLSRGSFGESNELDMLSSLSCLGEVCDKSTTSLGEVRVMEFDNDHDKRTLAARGGADQFHFIAFPEFR